MNFLESIKTFHGYWALLSILFLVFLVLLTLKSFAKKESPLSPILKKISFYTTLSFHIQLLLGVVMLIANSDLFSMSYKIQGAVNIMEHLMLNFTVVLLITVFNAKIKKASAVKPLHLVLIILPLVFLLARVSPLLSKVLN